MEENLEPASDPTPIEEEAPAYDMAKVEAFKAELESQQNFPLGIVGGTVAAIVGGAIWAVITVATEYQIGWMAIAVGFLSGYAVRLLGKGITNKFGILGALSALLGCALGNLLSACGFVAAQESMAYFDVLIAVLANPAAAAELMGLMFSPMDLLFYGLAIYEGYKFSFRQIDPEEVAGLTTAADE